MKSPLRILERVHCVQSSRYLSHKQNIYSYPEISAAVPMSFALKIELIHWNLRI